MKISYIIIFLFLSVSLLAFKRGLPRFSDHLLNKQVTDTDSDRPIPGNRLIYIIPETRKKISNPLTGWAIYATANTDANFWKNFDTLSNPVTHNKITIADYANILYIRLGWSDFEPVEGHYAWDTEGSIVKMLIDGAKERGLKLAFRINVDSRDKNRDFSPAYVKDAGAQGYETQSGRKIVWSPYPDDPVFQVKYEKFLKAFAKKFNNPDVVDFIDGYGLGKWGESHSVLYLSDANRVPVFNWITNLYLKYFTRIPLAINYHRLIGTSKEWGQPDPDSEPLLADAFKKGYMLRHDAFGMTDYYKSFEKELASQWFPERPVICEGGWVHNGNNLGYLKDSRGFKRWSDVWQGEYDDAMKARANVMDLRDIKETTSWFQSAYPLIEGFIAKGGYRLYPDRLSLPQTVKPNSKTTITHRWKNLGCGFCPTNLPQWHQKYKVAFALLSKNNQAVVAIYVDNQTDLSKWLQGKPVSYNFSPVIKQIPVGEYLWAVAIVDTSKNNGKRINLAVEKGTTTTGWLELSKVIVK